MKKIICEFRNDLDSLFISHIKRTEHYDMAVNHFHNRYEIYYLLSGERYYFIKDRTFHVLPGDLVLINAYDLHKTATASMNNHERILIEFDIDYLNIAKPNWNDILLFPFQDSNPIIRLPSSQRNIVEDLLFRMLEEINNHVDGFEAYLHVLLMELLIYLTRYMKENLIKSYEYLGPVHQKVTEIVQYINKNYSQPLTLDSVSQHFYISRYYLSRIFKEVTGFTFVEYLNNVRIMEAQRLLRESDLKVICISEAVGYESISHFGRVFKAISGVSPLQYRKKQVQSLKTNHKMNHK